MGAAKVHQVSLNSSTPELIVRGGRWFLWGEASADFYFGGPDVDTGAAGLVFKAAQGNEQFMAGFAYLPPGADMYGITSGAAVTVKVFTADPSG